jgi:ABC-type glycerol-3-phosphate transport system substrate-binding protein
MRPRTFGIALAIVAGLTLAACSSSGGGKGSDTTSPASTTSAATSTSPSFDRAAAQAQIKQNWEAFFSKATPLAKKLDYVEHGDALKDAVQRFGTDPRTKQASAKVTDVFASSPTSATVKYQVLLNGKVALPSASGTAIFEDGVWKVSVSTLCGLLDLMGGPKIPGC